MKKQPTKSILIVENKNVVWSFRLVIIHCLQVDNDSLHLLGSEDICTEQMQVLNMDVPVDQENQNPIFNNSKNNHEERNEKRKEIDQPKSKPSFGKPYDSIASNLYKMNRSLICYFDLFRQKSTSWI